MNFKELDIPGVFLITNFYTNDSRGIFVKPFSINMNSIKIDIKETYYSISHKGVVRGMHFQIPPMEHSKLIYVTSGEIVDVILDLRENSVTYNSHLAIKINAHKCAIFLPPGIAHGFISKKNNTTVVYNQSTTYSKNHDHGILWNSFGYDWGENNPIISKRDNNFPPLHDFKTPFK